MFCDDANVSKAKDRVYYLNFQTFEEKYFFWMQVIKIIQGAKYLDEEYVN